MTATRQGECAHCGVVLDLDDRETICLFIGDWAVLVYHPWCWEEAQKRILYIHSNREDLFTPVDLMDLGLIPKPDGE